MSKRTAPELIMTIYLTTNEVIAINGVITTYLRHLERTGTTQQFTEIIHLLERFQQRLAQQSTLAAALPPEKKQ